LAASLAAFAAYVVAFLPLLVTADGSMGFDYSYFLPQLLAGHYWFQLNGPFSVPWFTPAFCGGVPYFPNMQGIYYSLPQLLTFAVGPVRAVESTFLAFAAAGYGGFYVLLRRGFAAGGWSAVGGATLFLFNGFYFAHMAIGHLTFHAFMLAPWLAALAVAGTRGRNGGGPIEIGVVAGAAIVTYMIYSGMVHVLAPVLLAVAAICLIHGALFGASAQPFARLGVMCGIALFASAAKLTAGFAFLAQFPRDMLPLSGFGSLWEAVLVVLAATSVAPPAALTANRLLNTHWTLENAPEQTVILANHELDFRITALPALVVFVWAVAKGWSLARRGGSGVAPTTLAAGAGVAAILACPIVLNWYQPDWTGFLKSLPLFGNSSTLIRWLCVYVILGALGAALIVDREPALLRSRKSLALLATLFVVSTAFVVDRHYHTITAQFGSNRIEAAYRGIARGEPVPPISRIEFPNMAVREGPGRADRNEHLVVGGSSAECYEPMFGFFLEAYPRGALRPAPSLAASEGLLNLKNPACMVYPESNQCRPGDHFGVGQASEASRFLAYRPFDFEFPWWQRAANVTSLGALGLMLLAFALAAYGRVRRIAATLASGVRSWRPPGGGSRAAG
jgi:hypothetical protein